MTIQLGYPPEYVLDNMQMYEIRAVLEYQYLKHRESWEQTRLIAYVIAQSNSSKKLKVTDIMKFPWETDNNEENQMTKEDVEKLRAKAKMFEKLFQ